MNQQKYPCKNLEHHHNSRYERDKCNSATKIEKLKQRNITEAQEIKKCIQAKPKRKYSDCSLASDDQATFCIASIPNKILNVNDTLFNIDYIAAKRAADNFLRTITEINQQYLLWTDDDPEWIPIQRGQFNHWERSVCEQIQTQKTVAKKPKMIFRRFSAKEKQMKVKSIKNKNRRTKQQLGRIFETNTGLLNYYDLEYILRLLPTQIPKINQQYRIREKQKYERLQLFMIGLYLNIKQQKDAFPSKQIKQARKRLSRLNELMDILAPILKENIFNQRLPWRVHYEGIRQNIEHLIVYLWIFLKDLRERLGQGSRDHMIKQQLIFFSEWMGPALQKFNYEYCVSVGLITLPEPQFQQDAQEELFSKIDLARIKIEEIKAPIKIMKYYKSWNQLAHELGENYRQQHSKYEQFSTTTITKSIDFTKVTKVHNNINWKEINRMKKQRQLQLIIAKNKFQKFTYTRSYFWNSGPIYYISSIQQIRLYQKVYELFSKLDPICQQCYYAMKPYDDSTFINFYCSCGVTWTKKFKKLRKCQQFNVRFELQGKVKKEFYPSIINEGKRNNFHEYDYNWMRRAKYSQQIPYKIKTSIPIFSQRTNLQIEYNRQQENYLPLEITDSIIPNAGKGMRTTKQIKKGSLIITYTGVIKPHYEVKSNNNSLFSLGVINTVDNMAIIIDPVEYGNAAKYINTAYKKFVNCTAQLGIFKPRLPDLPEPAVIIVAIKDIKPNTELFYEYGNTYGDFKTIKQKKCQK